ncbi:DNA polymerase III subunit alpha [Streptococcus hongkongensis]|nr:DNA polymerase III DnaE [Streptococcus uberis]
MFAQLETKTVYSFMDSLIDLDRYFVEAKKLGYKTIGIMDKDNLYAAYHFITGCQKHGLQPVLGLEVDYPSQDKLTRLFLIATNNKGYKNLLKLSTIKMSGDLILAELENFSEGLVAIIPDQENSQELDLPLKTYFGIYQETRSNPTNYPLIALRRVRYFSDSDRESLQVLHAIRDNVNLNETAVIIEGQFLESAASLTEFFQAEFPEALSNLEELVSTISYQFDSELKLPRFNREIPAKDQLRQLTEEGLTKKNLWTTKYQERLDKELQIISEMGFDDYFLIVWDLLRFGRSKGYYMGMGRGSAAGSLVAYSLEITGIDPIKNDLLFERFLNKERYSMPDIDIDLPDIYRSEFLHYVRNRYGSDHSAQIVTFSTFGPKQAIRDVFKRFGLPEYELSHLTKKIGFKDTLDSVYQNNISFRQFVNSRLEYQRAFEIAKRIEGNPRQTSIHAAGIVMSDNTLTDHIPLKLGDDMMITQYDAAAVEANGLLKMDFLGLRNLTFVQKMQEKLLKEQGITISIADIDLEDKETLALFARGDTKGIFQFEQNGAISLLKRIKPVRFEEIVATTSLNRPGASDYSNNFIKRRNGQEAVDLIDPVIAPILESTYGIMLYQEQVMQIAQVFAGFSLGKADLLRRAMSKKNSAEMKKLESEFLMGASQLGRSPETAKLLFKRMEKFAGYGFNRSHAFAYSALAFQLAYFKAHYPSIFFDIIMNYSNSDYINDAIDSDFKVVPLSINTIPYTDKVENNTILMGMKNIKALPRDFAYWIIENRPFSGIENFMTRIPEKYKKKEVLLPLIKIGLFDQYEPNRRKVIENCEALLIFVNELGSLFADSSFSWVAYDDYSTAEKYQLEQETIGVGLSKHPLIALSERSKKPFVPVSKLVKDTETLILVQIDTIRIIRTKSNGQQMAFLSVTDTKTKCEVIIFPEQYAKVKDMLHEGQLYYISGKVKERDNRLQMILTSLQFAQEKSFWILVENHEQDSQIAEVLNRYPGNVPVIIHYKSIKETLAIDDKFVALTEEFKNEIATIALKTVYQ